MPAREGLVTACVAGTAKKTIAKIKNIRNTLFMPPELLCDPFKFTNRFRIDHRKIRVQRIQQTIIKILKLSKCIPFFLLTLFLPDKGLVEPRGTCIINTQIVLPWFIILTNSSYFSKTSFLMVMALLEKGRVVCLPKEVHIRCEGKNTNKRSVKKEDSHQKNPAGR
jgi:hypothetical protein